MGETLENLAKGLDTYSIRQPLGVTAGICPFNFPAMIPLWMFPVATACGNTMVRRIRGVLFFLMCAHMCVMTRAAREAL